MSGPEPPTSSLAESGSNTADAIAVEAIYGRRFPAELRAPQQALWQELVRHLQRYVPKDCVVLDIGADEGQFISQVAARERWAADLRDVAHVLPPDVRFVQGSGLDLDQRLPLGYFDRVFMSNYLEHLPSASDVIRQFRVAHALLKPGGRVIVIQPNITLIGGAYWDFIDHRVALTHHSLEEAADIAGFATWKMIVRFLPYTTKGRLPTAPWLVRAYLRFPPVWRIMGRQTLYIGERPL